MMGPGLIDFLISKLNNNINFKITLKNCDDPIFLIPLLYKYAKKNINSQIISSHKILAQITNKNIAVNKEIISTTYQEDLDLYLTKNIISEQKLDIRIQSYIKSKAKLNLSNQCGTNHMVVRYSTCYESQRQFPLSHNFVKGEIYL